MFENVKKSIEYLLKTESYEFRTTIVKELHAKEDIIEICKAIKGAKAYYLQNLKSDVELICGKKLTPFNEKEIEEIVNEGRKFVNVSYRKA
jgi:pyruvate formate lyase activating enzyme